MGPYGSVLPQGISWVHTADACPVNMVKGKDNIISDIVKEVPVLFIVC